MATYAMIKAGTNTLGVNQLLEDFLYLVPFGCVLTGYLSLVLVVYVVCGLRTQLLVLFAPLM